jgi:hypothetical protein
MDRKLNQARAIALAKKIISKPEQLQISKAKNKRFQILTDAGKYISFGLFPFSGAGTYLDHGDNKIRDAWRARHSKITLKDGRFAYKVKNTPEFLSWNILWP